MNYEAVFWFFDLVREYLNSKAVVEGEKTFRLKYFRPNIFSYE